MLCQLSYRGHASCVDWKISGTSPAGGETATGRRIGRCTVSTTNLRAKKNEGEAGIEPTWGDPVGLAGRRLDRPPPPPPRNLPRGAGVTPTQGGTVRRGYANLVSLRVEQMIASDDPFAGGVLHGAHRGPALVTRVRAQYPDQPGKGVIQEKHTWAPRRGSTCTERPSSKAGAVMPTINMIA